MGEDNEDNEASVSSSSGVQRPVPRESLRDILTLRTSPYHGNRVTSASRSLPASPSYELRRQSLSNGVSTPVETRDSISQTSDAASTISGLTGRQSTDTIKSPSTPSRSYLPTFSPLTRNILKCCIAYFIASLFTYSSYLSGFIIDIVGGDPGDRKPSPSGHMVSTMYVIASRTPSLTDLNLCQCCIFQPSQNCGQHVGSRYVLFDGLVICHFHLPQ